MDTEKSFNAIFWTLLALGLSMRAWFAFRVSRTGERIQPDRAAREREGFWPRAIERLFELLFAALVLDVCIQGGSLVRHFAFSASGWLRWTGVGLGTMSLGLFAWTHVTLGRFWSTCLQLRSDHQLITAGPYARIRHPMYSAILGWMMSLGLVAGSWIPFVFASLSALNFILRIQPEEKMMLQQFGEEYRQYMKRTGRLLPVYSMKSFIRNLSPSAEFVLVVLVCFWWAIPGSIAAIFSHPSRVGSAATYTDRRDLLLAVLELSGLAITFWIARVRGWSLRSFGLQPAWRSTGIGILLCIAIATVRYFSAVLANAAFPGAVKLLPVTSRLSLPVLILTLAINPAFEEIIETGYFVRSLERYGMWCATLASALFRAFLHAHLGVNAIVVVFPIGLIFGFVYWKQRQLWPLVVAHALFDLYALFPRSHAG